MLVERLADPGHVAVTEDPEAAGEEAVLDLVPFDYLCGEKADQCLRGGEPQCLRAPICVLDFTCGSSIRKEWSFHVSVYFRVSRHGPRRSLARRANR